MFLVHIVIAVCACVCFFNFIRISEAHHNDESSKPHKEKEDELEDIQQKTPLIDIIFSDGTSRTCTGAIIHEYVVITAGHCFIPIRGRSHQRDVIAELTGSFVVIGTKKKFDSGYEQYLPIERVITHPNMKGWSCDLALVYTFASMTSDKVGAVMPLAGEKTSTSIEPNVTILSWGRVIESIQDTEPTTEDPCCVGDKFCDSEEQSKCAQKNKEQNEEQKEYTEDHTQVVTHNHEVSHVESMLGEEKVSTALYRGKEHNSRYDSRFVLRKGANIEYTTKQGSRYLSSAEILKKLQGTANHEGAADVDKVTETKVQVGDGDEDDKLEPMQHRRFVYEGQSPMENQQRTNWAPTATNWRRQMGDKGGNKLTLETFGFLNAATCKKMLLRAQPDMEIHGSEIVCYASDDHYVTEEDSGAPVVRLGQLIAVTIGGIKSEGDHVAVGMKLSYFCPWINENLPPGDASLNCWAQTPHTQSQHTQSNESSVIEETYKRIRIH